MENVETVSVCTRTHARKRVHDSTIVIALITHRIVLAAGETADSGCVW